MPTRKYEDTFLFTLENFVIVPRKTVFFNKNWFWLMSLPARNYPLVRPVTAALQVPVALGPGVGAGQLRLALLHPPPVRG